jgi:hypothetical protein
MINVHIVLDYTLLAGSRIYDGTHSAHIRAAAYRGNKASVLVATIPGPDLRSLVDISCLTY